MKVLILLFALVLATSCAEAQTKPTSETTYGSCSPNMSHNSGSITINCKGLDPTVAAEIVELVKQVSLLNKVTATTKNQQLMIKILKEIQTTVINAAKTTPIVQTTTAPCTAQSVGGNANVTDCNPTNPYKAVTTWTPDGLRTTRDGNKQDFYGPFKEPVFAMLNRLEAADDWNGILNWSHAQQQAYPDWFTPDYVAGTAEARLCELQKARIDLDKFVSETTDATSYASLRDKAQRLRNELDQPREGLMCPAAR